MVEVDEEREKDDKVMEEYVETTTYTGGVDDWEDHLSDTEQSDDEPDDE